MFLVFLLIAAVVAAPFIAIKYNQMVKKANSDALKGQVVHDRREHPAFEIPRGEYGANVYIYDGTPLQRGLHRSRVMLDVLPGVTGMRSIYTNTDWQGECALAYNHRPIGFVSTENAYFDILALMAEKHSGVRVHAVIVGDNPGGWPIVKLELPEYGWFKEGGYWPY